MSLVTLRAAKSAIRRARLIRFSRKKANRGIDGVKRATDLHRPKIRKVFTHAAKSARASVDVRGLENALQERSFVRAQNAVDFALDTLEHRLRRDLPKSLRAAVVAGGLAEAKLVRSKGFRSAKANLAVSFNATNDKATKWAERRSAQRVTEIGRDARASIREIVGSMFDRGVSSRSAARQIREVVGLTSDQASAVARLRASLENADGSTVSAFAGKLNFKVPEGGASEEQIDAWTERYADKLLDHRASMIARTEANDAANEGQRELWQQSVANGWLGEDSKRKWIAGGPNMCAICEEMDGQTVGLDEPFVLPDGEEIDGPTAHPGCTCGQGITVEKEGRELRSGVGGHRAEACGDGSRVRTGRLPSLEVA